MPKVQSLETHVSSILAHCPQADNCPSADIKGGHLRTKRKTACVGGDTRRLAFHGIGAFLGNCVRLRSGFEHLEGVIVEVNADFRDLSLRPIVLDYLQLHFYCAQLAEEFAAYLHGDFALCLRARFTWYDVGGRLIGKAEQIAFKRSGGGGGRGGSFVLLFVHLALAEKQPFHPYAGEVAVEGQGVVQRGGSASAEDTGQGGLADAGDHRKILLIHLNLVHQLTDSVLHIQGGGVFFLLFHACKDSKIIVCP